MVCPWERGSRHPLGLWDFPSVCPWNSIHSWNWPPLAPVADECEGTTTARTMGDSVVRVRIHHQKPKKLEQSSRWCTLSSTPRSSPSGNWRPTGPATRCQSQNLEWDHAHQRLNPTIEICKAKNGKVDNFVLEDELLYKIHNSKKLLVVPYDLVERILHFYHNVTMSAHLSKDRITKLLESRFYRPRMKSDIAD